MATQATMTEENVAQEGSDTVSSFDPFQSEKDEIRPSQSHRPKPKRKFRSSRLQGEYPKPWLRKIDQRAIWGTVILYSGALLGIGAGFAASYLELGSAPLAKFCESPYWVDEFTSLDPEKWFPEVQINGFGTGSFDWTTTDSQNAYVDATGLHIVPTLTTESTDISLEELIDGYKLNLTSSGGDGSCTAPEGWENNKACSISSNYTKSTMINPVRSARLCTKHSLNMRYGRIEVEAKLPIGDWLWPAIWMMPVDSKYGIWPASGEIDIMESRGNDPNTYPEGRDTYSSTIHWGPNALLNGYWRKTVPARLWRSDFSKDFHTYSIEWTPDYIYTYYDNKLQSLLYTRFGGKHGDMWEQGEFEGTYVNGTNVNNPWQKAAPNAPFDQDFYLILNVAVGGTNGFFQDGSCYSPVDSGQRYCAGNKPWRNDSPRAVIDFWDTKDAWYPTWGEGDTRGMTIRSVKAYKYGGC